MTSKNTVKEQIAEMRAVADTRYEHVQEERKQVRQDIKDLTNELSGVKSNMTGMNTEVFNLSERVIELKTDVKDGFTSLYTKMDTHFNNKPINGNRDKIKKGGIVTGIFTAISGIVYGIYELGLLFNFWARIN